MPRIGTMSQVQQATIHPYNVQTTQVRLAQIRTATINGLAIHICVEGEYDPVTLQPTIQNPAEKQIYLVPGGKDNNLYSEWVWINNAWELFGSASIDLSDLIDDTTTANNKTWSSNKISDELSSVIPAKLAHTLTFGAKEAYTFDGSADVVVPVYGGQII